MVGRELSDDYPEPKRKIGETLLKVEHLKNKRVHDVSFELKKGEILGFGGLVGAGRTELVRAIYGADQLNPEQLLLMVRNIRQRVRQMASRPESD